MQVILDRLSLLFRARYPLVHLITHEEERVERALEKLAGRENMVVYRWRGTTGLSGPSGPVEGTEPFQAMLGALSAVSVPAMFLCFDPHPYLSDPSSVRRLRDLAHAVGSRNQAVVLVGPELRVPIELDKELTVLDVPLPDRDEVGKLLGLLLRSQRLEVPADLFERFVKGSLGLTEREIKRLYARILLSGGRFVEADLASLGDRADGSVLARRLLKK